MVFGSVRIGTRVRGSKVTIEPPVLSWPKYAMKRHPRDRGGEGAARSDLIKVQETKKDPTDKVSAGSLVTLVPSPEGWELPYR